ncbi:MAG: carbohydrate-binding protein, partial [Micromonosporaceae bacterium]
MARKVWVGAAAACALLLVPAGIGYAELVPSGGDLAAAATTYQAEDATISQGVVESNHAGFTGSGFVNYDNVTGSYVEFMVNAAAAGPATLTLRYANGTSANRPMDISVDGALAENDLAFNGTGAWSTWQTATAMVTLNAGANKIRATAVGTSGGPNLDRVDVDQAAPSADYQAEDASISQGVVESNHAGFTGSGFVNYNNVTGSYVQFTVNAAAAGSTELSFRFANGSSANRPMDITVNGSLAANDLGFGVTGAWSTWQTATTTVTLNAGSNTIRATAVGSAGGPNLDKLTIGSGG